MVSATKLPDNVIAKQLERTDLSYSKIGDEQRATIEAAGIALQQAGVLKADVDVKKVTNDLIDPAFGATLGQ